MSFLIGMIFLVIATKAGIIPAIAVIAIWFVLWLISRIGQYPPEKPPENKCTSSSAEEDRIGFGFGID